MVYYHPEQIINRYVWEQFRTHAPNFYNLYAPTSGGPEIIPFFPAPGSSVPASMIESDMPHIIFDKFSRVRRAASSDYKNNQIYSIKTDQMRYSIIGGTYGTNYGARDRFASTMEITGLIYRILDREDEAARDINEFAPTLPGYLESNEMYRYYFHNIQVYQSGFTDTQMDVDNFMEYNPSRDLIIRYDYHFKQFNEN